MYHTCLYCTKDLGSNDVLETLPIGRRVAFDAAQGRLWVVCRSCEKWNLVPFDTRLETIEDCERLFSDARLRFSTDNIGLARVREGLDLIRIGAPQRPEFASWRYGEQYRMRRRRALATSGVGFTTPVVASQLMHVLSVGSVAAGFGVAVAAQAAPAAVEYFIARRRRLRLLSPDGIALALYDSQLATAALGWNGPELTLKLVSAWNWRKAADPHQWTGRDARQLTRRILARMNRKSGSKEELSDALSLLSEQSGKLDAWLYWLSQASWPRKGRPWSSGSTSGAQYWATHGKDALPILTLSAANRLAIEMWLSEEDETKAMAGELALLERQWQEADELAAITDSLAVSDDIHANLSKKT